jgi:hypothetical protein
MGLLLKAPPHLCWLPHPLKASPGLICRSHPIPALAIHPASLPVITHPRLCSSRLVRLHTPSANHSQHQSHPTLTSSLTALITNLTAPHHNCFVLRLDVKRQINTSSCKAVASSHPHRHSLSPWPHTDSGGSRHCKRVVCFASGAPGRLLKQPGTAALQASNRVRCLRLRKLYWPPD